MQAMQLLQGASDASAGLASPGKRKRDGADEDADFRQQQAAAAVAASATAAAAVAGYAVNQQPRVAPPSECSSGSGSREEDMDDRSGSIRGMSDVSVAPQSELGAAAATSAAATAAAAMAAGAAATASASIQPGGGDGVLGGLPLRGCVSEYVQRWGWAPLPQGTEQMLRDILSTLRSMGLRFTLDEAHSLQGSPTESAGAAGAAGGGGGDDGELSTHQLKLTILF